MEAYRFVLLILFLQLSTVDFDEMEKIIDNNITVKYRHIFQHYVSITVLLYFIGAIFCVLFLLIVYQTNMGQSKSDSKKLILLLSIISPTVTVLGFVFFCCCLLCGRNTTKSFPGFVTNLERRVSTYLTSIVLHFRITQCPITNL